MFVSFITTACNIGGGGGGEGGLDILRGKLGSLGGKLLLCSPTG